MREKPRMLLLTPWPGEWRPSEPNPSTRYVLPVLQQAFEVHLLFPARRPGAFPPEERGFHLHPVPGLPPTARRGPWAHLRAFPELGWALFREGQKILHRQRFHLVYGHSGFVAWPVWALGRRFGLPTALKLFGVVRYSEIRPTPRSVLVNLEHELAYRLPVLRLLVVNDGTGGRVMAQRRGILHRFVELPQSRPSGWSRRPQAEARRALKLPLDRPMALVVSRLDLFKGLHLLPDLVARIHRQVPEARVAIVGTGPLEPVLRRDLERRGLLEVVRFLGYIPHERLAQVYAAADVFLGIADLSTCTRPVVEALTLGVPVVAWELLYSRECLRDSPGVVWVRPLDTEAFAHQVALLLTRPEVREALGKQAEAHALQAFPTIQEVARREVETLLRLVPGGVGAAAGLL